MSGTEKFGDGSENGARLVPGAKFSPDSMPDSKETWARQAFKVESSNIVNVSSGKLFPTDGRRSLGSDPAMAEKAMAELQMTIGLSNARTQALADAIDYLGQQMGEVNPAALVEVVKELVPTAKAKGLSETSAAALSATLLGEKVQLKIAAEGGKELLHILSDAKSGTAAEKAIWKSKGINPEDLSSGMQTNPETTIIKALSALKNMTDKERETVLRTSEFGMKGMTVTQALVKNPAALENNFSKVASPENYTGSLYHSAQSKDYVQSSILMNMHLMEKILNILSNGVHARGEASHAQISDNIITDLTNQIIVLNNSLSGINIDGVAKPTFGAFPISNKESNEATFKTALDGVGSALMAIPNPYTIAYGGVVKLSTLFVDMSEAGDLAKKAEEEFMHALSIGGGLISGQAKNLPQLDQVYGKSDEIKKAEEKYKLGVMAQSLGTSRENINEVLDRLIPYKNSYDAFSPTSAIGTAGKYAERKRMVEARQKLQGADTEEKVADAIKEMWTAAGDSAELKAQVGQVASMMGGINQLNQMTQFVGVRQRFLDGNLTNQDKLTWGRPPKEASQNLMSAGQGIIGLGQIITKEINNNLSGQMSYIQERIFAGTATNQEKWVWRAFSNGEVPNTITPHSLAGGSPTREGVPAASLNPYQGGGMNSSPSVSPSMPITVIVNATGVGNDELARQIAGQVETTMNEVLRRRKSEGGASLYDGPN